LFYICCSTYFSTTTITAPGVSATPHQDNLRYFKVVIAGPKDTPYDGGLFSLELFLPDNYPMEAPKVRFLTKIYHPVSNIRVISCFAEIQFVDLC